MSVKERLAALRNLMEQEGLDAFIVSGTDPHDSEYLPACWQQREWISGFTGSFGTVVVLKDDAGLWTDTRYFIQAEKELKDTGIRLHRLRVPDAVDYPEWLAGKMENGQRVGVDSFCTSVSDMEHLKGLLKEKGIGLVDKPHLIGDIWLDRPGLPEGPLFRVSDKVTGCPADRKIGLVRKVLEEKKADYFIFSALDEIAWMFNVRSSDIDYTPVAISYAVVGRESAWLFVRPSKVSAEVADGLKEEGIGVRDYHQLFLFLDEIEEGKTFCTDCSSLNYAVYNKLKGRFRLIQAASPLSMAKAVKNPTEIEGFRKAFLKDSVAMTRFFYWLEQNIGKHLTETEVSDRLTAIRAMDPDYVSDSFGNISAYGTNAALPHYSAVPGADSVLEPKGLYLVDSGAQYTHGTTDLTRTVPLGPLTQLEKDDYTLVLKAMIALACAVFPRGTRGCNIDAVCRQPLWQTCRNFGHGTGHGVGFFLNVHEGPQAIRQDLKDQALVPGMLTSDEPGLYREGYHGIRHENLILCVPLEENEFGVWYGFETMTLCYFDTTALNLSLMTDAEKEWLNAYNSKVYGLTAPYLTAEEAAWLEEKTRAV